MGLDRIISGIRYAGKASLETEAVNIPLASYNSRELFALEVEKLFRPGWMMVGRVEEVATPDSYLAVDVVGEPLLVTRDSDGQLHVFSRLCAHRGMEIACGSGTARRLTCPYHSWSFDLAGRCRSAPFMNGSEGFRLDDHGLQPVRFELWKGFIFVNLSGDAAPLGARLGLLDSKLAGSGVENMLFIDTIDFGEQPVDWKLLLENSVECYHHCGTHAKSLQARFPAELSWAETEEDAFGITYSVAKDDNNRRGDEVALERINKTTGTIVTIYPLMHFLYRDNSVFLLQFEPLGPGRCRAVGRLMMTPEAAESSAGPEILDAHRRRMRAVLGEDFDMCARLQKLASAGLMEPGRLSPRLEQPVWHFYRYLADHLVA